jgi:hypothetical protein
VSSAHDRARCSYFVDEAGDGTLFDHAGRVIVGSKGCSQYFILGLAEVVEPEALSRALAALRTGLLADSYYGGVPSMRPERGKTAVAFHATDDIPEVRERVYRLLAQHGIRFFAVVWDKRSVLEYVRQRNERDQTYRYHPNELYEHMVRRLFRDRLHSEEAYDICFARRGKSDRTDALMSALGTARQRFTARFGIRKDVRIAVRPCWSREEPCLQAVDYLLWAVQRLFEKREERFLKFVWPLVRLVHDVDDTREAEYGTYYTKDRPLTLAALKQEPEI